MAARDIEIYAVRNSPSLAFLSSGERSCFLGTLPSPTRRWSSEATASLPSLPFFYAGLTKPFVSLVPLFLMDGSAIAVP